MKKNLLLALLTIVLAPATFEVGAIVRRPLDTAGAAVEGTVDTAGNVVTTATGAENGRNGYSRRSRGCGSCRRRRCKPACPKKVCPKKVKAPCKKCVRPTKCLTCEQRAQGMEERELESDSYFEFE